MNIGILIAGLTIEDIAKTHGQYDRQFEVLLAGHGFNFESFYVVNDVFPDSIHDKDGWIVTGSRHGAYEDHAFIPPLETFIRDCFDAHIPMIGVCFGHQIIAQALGGKVVKFPGGWVVGRKIYEIDGAELPIMAWHQDQVVEKPATAEVLASHDTCQYAALIYDDRIMTTQPHPEFNGDYVIELAEKRGAGVVPDAQLAEVMETVHDPLAHQAMADKFAAFLKAKHAQKGPQNGI